jgi:hypothetical protein
MSINYSKIDQYVREDQLIPLLANCRQYKTMALPANYVYPPEVVWNSLYRLITTNNVLKREFLRHD